MPVAVAPNPLAPGFPRSWPECQPAMQVIARHLLAYGAEDEEIIDCLVRDFPALPGASTRDSEADALWWAQDAAWRKRNGFPPHAWGDPTASPDQSARANLSWRADAYFANVVAAEKMYMRYRQDMADYMRDEPSGFELQGVASADDLIRLCKRYWIRFALHEEPGDLRLSRKVRIDGPVHLAIKRYKADLLRLLSGGPE